MARPTKPITLQRCYTIYKSATEKALNLLFAPGTGIDKTCKEIETKVKQLKSKKRRFAPEFFRSLKEAIFWRRLAAERYKLLETPVGREVDASNQGHDYFIRLLITIDKSFQVEDTAGKDDDVSFANMFEHLVLENDVLEADDIMVKDLTLLQEQETDLTSENKSQPLLEVDHLSTILELLARLKTIMQRATTYCQRMHDGDANIVNTSLLLSVVYAEVKAMCSHTAMLVDKWSEVDTWVKKSVWKDFGLDEHYDNLKLIVIMAPMLYADLQTMETEDMGARLTDESHLISAYDEGSQGLHRSVLDVLDDEHAAGRNVAVQAMRIYMADDSLTAADLQAAARDNNHRLSSAMHNVNFLRKALQAFSQRRRLHEELNIGSVLVENPALKDLHDFLVADDAKPVAALSVMMGGGLMRLLMNPTAKDVEGHWASSAASYITIYHNVLNIIGSDVTDKGENQVLPDTLVPIPPVLRNEYAPLVFKMDVWTMGLCYAQIAAALNQVVLISALTAVKSRFAAAGFLYMFDYLRLCAGDQAQVPVTFRSFLRYVRLINGQGTEPQTLKELLAHCTIQLSNTSATPKARKKALAERMNDPRLCLTQLLLENEYKVQAEWIHELSTTTGNDGCLDSLVNIVEKTLTEQLTMSFHPKKLFNAFLYCDSPTEKQYKCFGQGGSLKFKKLVPPSAAQAKQFVDELVMTVNVFLENVDTYTYWPLPECITINVSSPQDPVFGIYLSAQRRELEFYRWWGTMPPFDHSSWENFLSFGGADKPWRKWFDEIARDLQNGYGIDIKSKRPFLFPRISLGMSVCRSGGVPFEPAGGNVDGFFFIRPS